MKKTLLALALLPAIAAFAQTTTTTTTTKTTITTTTMSHEDHQMPAPAPMAQPASTDWAKQRLAASPRHREWVKVKSGNREVSAFVVYPEVKNKATSVVVIHEIFGM